MSSRQRLSGPFWKGEIIRLNYNVFLSSISQERAHPAPGAGGCRAPSWPGPRGRPGAPAFVAPPAGGAPGGVSATLWPASRHTGVLVLGAGRGAPSLWAGAVPRRTPRQMFEGNRVKPPSQPMRLPGHRCAHGRLTVCLLLHKEGKLLSSGL